MGKLLTGAKNPLVLLVSGGHTMILAFSSGRWRVFGETLDITLGQLLDQFGRSLGFASPCGRKIEELANKSTNYVDLPYVVKGNDVSFSGLLSAAKQSTSKGVEDACYSLQETAFAMIAEATERALAFTRKNEIMIVGGVAANEQIRQNLSSVCNDLEIDFIAPPLELCTDNAAMIAYAAGELYDLGQEDENSLSPRSRWPLDEKKPPMLGGGKRGAKA